MAYDRFLIAPLNTGLKTDARNDRNVLFYNNASYVYNDIFTRRRIMSRENRADTKDILGMSFFDLTVIRKAEHGKHRGVKWVCRCKCGNETIAYGGHLRAGKRKSCGCRSQERIEESGIHKLYSLYKRKAEIRKKEFSISLEQFAVLVKGNCIYCGAVPAQILKRQKSEKVQVIYNGIDRIDPQKGYVQANCVSACRKCNVLKASMGFNEFKSHIERIYSWLMIGS